MIRPRTIHRQVEAPPPPPPAAPVASNTSESSAAAAGSRKRLLIVCLSLVFLYLFYSSFIRSSDDDDGVLGFASSDSTALRGGGDNNNAAISAAFTDDDDEEEEEKPKAKMKKNTVAAPVDEDDEEGNGDDEDSPSTDNDAEDADDGEETSSKMEEDENTSAEDDEDEEKPQAEVQHTERKPRSNNGGPRDPARSVQSYFSNFGGNVVEIDREGSYKFVLIKFEDSSGDSALLVRGCPKTEGTHCKHHHAFSRAKAELEQRGFVAKVRGGGRITRHPSRHRPGQKEGYISVFGYSKTFGACEDCNKITCQLIKAAFPDHGVKYSNEGYSESDERKIPDSSWTKC